MATFFSRSSKSSHMQLLEQRLEQVLRPALGLALLGAQNTL